MNGRNLKSPLAILRAFSDVGNKQRVTEFVCLALETSSGRQLGRFARYVRVVPPPAPAPPAAASVALPATLPPQLLVPSILPPQQLPHQPQLLQPTAPPQQVASGAVLPAGVVVPADGAAAAAAAPAAPPVVTGVANPESSALPLPDVLQDLQQWMASVGLNPGPPDAGGFSERGNFRFDLTLCLFWYTSEVYICMRIDRVVRLASNNTSVEEEKSKKNPSLRSCGQGCEPGVAVVRGWSNDQFWCVVLGGDAWHSRIPVRWWCVYV